MGKEGDIVEMDIFLGSSISEEELVTAQKDMSAGKSVPQLASVLTTDKLKKASISRGKLNRLSIFTDSSVLEVKKLLCIVRKELLIQAIYIYADIVTEMTADSAYRELKVPTDSVIDGYKLQNFAFDIGKTEFANTVEPSDTYGYTDVIDLKVDYKETVIIKKAIGIGTSTKFSFPADPWQYQRTSSVSSYSNDGVLLLDGGVIKNNVLYYVDYRQFNEMLNRTESYFPALVAAGVSSAEEFDEKQEQLELASAEIRDTSSALYTSFALDSIASIAESATSPADVLVLSGNMSLFSPAPFSFPLDVIFKQLHATAIRPLIKYNPGRRREKIYRLYAPTESLNGRKIPFLPKALIFKLVKILATEKQLSVLIVEHDFPIVLNFFSDSSISIVFTMKEAMPEHALLSILQKACNPVIKDINLFMSPKGYSLPLLSSFKQNGFRYNSVDLQLVNTMPHKLDLLKGAKCMRPIFSIGNQSAKNDISLSYIRVADYNKMNSMQEFITNRINSGVPENELLMDMVAEFRLENQQVARNNLLEFVSQQKIVRDAYRSSRVKIRGSPGFKVSLVPEPYKGNIIITVKGVTSSEYLPFISKYVNALLELSRGDKISGINKTDLLKLCAQNTSLDAEVPPQKAIKTVRALNEGDRKAKDDLMQFLIDDTDSDDSDTEGGTLPSIASETDASADAGGIPLLDSIDVTGMKLLNPNPFSLLLQERQPLLFRRKKDKSTYSYARACPSNNRRQPVILSTEEKDRIDRDHPGSYTKSLSYKESPDSQTYHYICPRFWDLKRKTSLTQAEAESGDYGGIIPQGARTVPAGASIYEFDGAYHTGSDGERTPLYPGFMSPKGHPGDKCVPCCFKSWDAPSRVKLRKTCLDEGKVSDDEDTKFDDYIKGPEKWPLDEDRLGFLPTGVENILGVSSKDCKVSASNAAIKSNTPCVIRMGLGKERNKSFVSAVSALLVEVTGRKALGVKNTIKRIVKSLTIDRFRKAQNGALISFFAPSAENASNSVLNYKNSALGRSVDKNIPSQNIAYAKIESARKGFIDYLNDDESVVDHQYLWDLITAPDKNLFPSGINLIILEEGSDSNTNDVNVLCPSNAYANELFNPKIPSAILYLKDGLYELVVMYEDRKRSYAIARLFYANGNDGGVSAHLQSVLQNIGATIGTKCRPLPSLPNVYEYQPGAAADVTAQALANMNFKLKQQVLDYNGKTVGFIFEHGPYNGLLPCLPSILTTDELPIIWKDDVVPGEYSSTLDYLKFIQKESLGKVAVQPVARLVEDGMNVGIVTSSNQTILVKPSQASETDSLPPLNAGNPKGVDRLILTSLGVDTDRIEAMRKIDMETNFYNTFRNQIRVLLTSQTNSAYRSELIKELDSKATYQEKLQAIANVLENVIGSRVRFTTGLDVVLPTTDDTIPLFGMTICKAGDDDCTILVPKRNLINGLDNESAYYVRVADEFVRYSRIRSFLLSPDAYLSFDNVPYQLNNNELVLLQSLLDQSYFEGLLAKRGNQFVEGSSYDMAEPIKTQTYSNKVNLDIHKPTVEDDNSALDFSCADPSIVKITGKWAKSYPAGCAELKFSSSPPECTFQAVTAIIGKASTTQTRVSLIEVKEVLVREYRRLWPTFAVRILAVMQAERKGPIVKRIKKGETNLQSEILSPGYECSKIDIWILSQYFALPIVLYAPTSFRHTTRNVLPLYADADTRSFFFLKVPGSRSSKTYGYRLVIKDMKFMFSYDELRSGLGPELKEAIDRDDYDLDKYLAEFKAIKFKIVKSFGKTIKLGAQ
tara:strand:- start:5822 stop:11155 length:5334 start_codon:yes stop_codon:yes gene_type:complete